MAPLMNRRGPSSVLLDAGVTPSRLGRLDGAESSQALASERLQNGRLVNLLRFLGTTLFLALVLFEKGLNWTGNHGGYLAVLAGYWLLSLIVYAGGRLSDRLTRLSSALIPVLDVPLVFLIQLGVMRDSTDPRAVADFALSEYLVLLMLAATTLRGWAIVATGVTTIVAEQGLQYLAGESDIGKLGGVLLLGIAASLCEFARRRRLEMLDRVCSERLSRERLGRYFSPQVAEHIQQQADGLAAGQDCQVTVLFADLCGFTALSAQLGSARTVALLNDFHSHMVEVIFDSGGTLDKYIGDGLMAYFGAPLTQPDHAQRAIGCALAMHDALAHLNRSRTSLGEPPLRMGIGIHSGPAVVGSIGAPHRREFTVVGDTVNVASRLEQVAKSLEEEIVISEAARQRVAGLFLCQPLDRVSVKGKAAPLSIYAPKRVPVPDGESADASAGPHC